MFQNTNLKIYYMKISYMKKNQSTVYVNHSDHIWCVNHTLTMDHIWYVNHTLTMDHIWYVNHTVTIYGM